MFQFVVQLVRVIHFIFLYEMYTRHDLEKSVYHILQELVVTSMKLMKYGKDAGTPLIIIEMLKGFVVDGSGRSVI